MIAKILPFLGLLYGLFSVFTLQRDFEHIGRLLLSVLLIGPAFVLLTLLPTLLDRLGPDSFLQKYRIWVERANLTMTQAVTQYILMFCLPFFALRESWTYFGLHLLALGITLWDPLYKHLVKHPSFRHLLQAWTLLAAFSFLFPFLFPSMLGSFYWMLAALVLIAFIPTQKERRYLFSQSLLCALVIIPQLILPLPKRFPLLSVWLMKPQLAFDRNAEHEFYQNVPSLLSWSELKMHLDAGENICCVAPVVAPPLIREQLTQEWWLGDRLIERTLLKTPVRGGSGKRAFRSYFCKRNFQVIREDASLRCEVYLKDSIYLGGTRREIQP